MTVTGVELNKTAPKNQKLGAEKGNMEEENKQYNIREASQTLNVPQNTLRNLCNSGLVPGVRRNRLYHRILEEWQVNHIRTLLGLRAAGLSKTELKRYVRLVRQGDKTLPARKALMDTQKRQLWQTLEDIQQGIDFLERQADLLDQEISAQQDEH